MRLRGPRSSSATRTAEEPTVAINASGRRNFRRRRLRAALRRWRWLMITVAALALIAGGTWLLYFSDHLISERVEVSGNDSVATRRVVRVAQVPLGEQLARLDVDAIRARVESIAAIDRAEVSRSWPDTLSIAVTERVPAAIVERGERSMTVDLDGVVFDGPQQGLLRIRTSEELGVEALAEGARVAASLPDALSRRVDHLRVESRDRIELRLTDGRRIVWGSAADSRQKGEVALALLARRARVIDVTAPGRPTTR